MLKAMKEDKDITFTALSRIMNINEAEIDKNVRSLREIGMVWHVGPARTGYWVVNFQKQ